MVFKRERKREWMNEYVCNVYSVLECFWAFGSLGILVKASISVMK